MVVHFQAPFDKFLLLLWQSLGMTSGSLVYSCHMTHTWSVETVHVCFTLTKSGSEDPSHCNRNLFFFFRFLSLRSSLPAWPPSLTLSRQEADTSSLCLPNISCPSETLSGHQENLDNLTTLGMRFPLGESETLKH